MPEVNSLDEAIEFFLRNSSGTVRCKDGDREAVVSSYPEAKTFYEQH